MSATFSSSVLCVVILLNVAICAESRVKQYQLLKEISPIDQLFQVDRTNGTLKDDLFKVERHLIDKISSLKTYFDNEKETRHSLQSALDIATKQIKALTELLLEQNACIKQIEVLKEMLMKKNTPCTCIEEELPNSTKSTTDRFKVTNGLRVRDVPVKERNFTLFKTIRTNSSGGKAPILNDIVVLTQENRDVIVVTDVHNICVKSFWFDPFLNRMFSSNLTMCDFPYSLDKISETQIVVSCFLTTQIYIVNVSPDLSMNSTINTVRGNRAVACMTSHTQSGRNTTLVTGHGVGMSLINMQGVVVKHMDLDITGKKYLKGPNYLTISPSGNILISDGVRSLICITPKREVLWKYAFKGIHGIACDAQGNIYVVNHYNNKVIVLSSDGMFIKEVLSGTDGIDKPTGLYYNPMKGRIYILELDSGLIKIFEHK